LIRRYMRFLSDVELEDGTVVKAHCPNPGSMLGLKDVGTRVWLEHNDDPKKKLDWGWRLVELPEAIVGIDTSVANKIVAEALATGIEGLDGYDSIRPEVKYREKSRVDFLFLVQRTDCTRVTLAEDLDPTYAKAFSAAIEMGVEVMCFACEISPDGIAMAQRVPFRASQ